MMVTERAQTDGFLPPHTPPALRPPHATPPLNSRKRLTARSISNIDVVAVSNAQEAVASSTPRLCACGCELSDGAGTCSPIAGLGGAGIQSNLQPQATIFGAPAQVLYRSTGAFACDSSLAIQCLNSRGSQSPVPTTLFLPSYVQGSSHPSGKQLPQFPTRFCQPLPSTAQSMPELSDIPGTAGELDGTPSEGPGARARRGKITGSWSTNKIISQIKGKKLMSMGFSKKRGEVESAGSEGKVTPDGSGHEMNSVPIVPRAAQCLQTQPSCLRVSWSQASLQESIHQRSPKGLFGRFRESHQSPRAKTDADVIPSSPSAHPSPAMSPAQVYQRIATGAPDPFVPRHWGEVFSGEDRGQVIVTSGGHTFIGVYDGFMDCAAVDFLMAHLYPCLVDEIDALDVGAGTPCQHMGSDDPIHSSVLQAMEKAYARCEALFQEMVHLLADEQPELAVAGACVAVAVILGQHLYTLNIGDSSVVLLEDSQGGSRGPSSVEDECTVSDSSAGVPDEGPGARKLTVDHNTSNEEEVARVVQEHLDDPSAVDKGRVKGKLRVTRAFGGVFMKQAQMNKDLFSCFRIKYVGDKPYLGSKVNLRHQPLMGINGYLVVSSDGLYQYMGHSELPAVIGPHLGKASCGVGRSAVCQRLAQGLLEEALLRAANKCSMSAESLAEMQAGDSRRKIHDDVTIVVLRLGN